MGADPPILGVAVERAREQFILGNNNQTYEKKKMYNVHVYMHHSKLYVHIYKYKHA